VLAGGAANRENGGGFAAEKGHGAGDVDPAAAGFKYRRAAAEFPFRVDLRVSVALSSEGASVSV
jgi:hypothetical protein